MVCPAQRPLAQPTEELPQTHTEAEAETFAADVVQVTEQVAENEKAQPEAVSEPEVIAAVSALRNHRTFPYRCASAPDLHWIPY